MNRRPTVMAVSLAWMLVASGGRLAAADTPDPGFESFYNYLGNHPTEASPGWHNNTQGITHDDDYWYITQTGLLFKVPVSHDLSRSFADNPEITYTGIGFDLDGYDHYGDLTEQDGYLFIAVTGDNDPIIAVYRADDLSFVGSDFITDDRGDPIDAGWCALDPDGYLYTSVAHPWSIWQFAVDWDALENNVVDLTLTGNEFLLRDETGTQTRLFHMQGGVFSPSGQELYIVNGFMTGSLCDGDERSEDWMREHGGVHVFELDGRQLYRVGKSTNGYGHFNYEFHPGGTACEEPEGITIWDLDDGRAPNVTGQLHVILTDQNLTADEVYVKHYTQKILVDPAHTGSENGTPGTPFNTVIEAVSLAWDGSVIEVEGGSYPEALTANTRTRLTAVNGPVTIGN